MPRGNSKKHQRKTRSELAQNTKVDADTENLNRETALEYVNQIKKEFADTPEVYAEFTQTLKDFDAWTITTDEFILKVCALFCDKPHLVTGLNRFLPTGFKIQQCEDGMYRCKVIPALKKPEEMRLTKSKIPATADPAVEKEEEREDNVEEFVYDIKLAQELYKKYCKERRSKDVAKIQECGMEIRRLVVPLCQWLNDEYHVVKKGLLFTKMMRSIKKIMMLEERYECFEKHVAPSLGEHAEKVKKEFLDQHCMAYHRLVEGYMQTNDVLVDDDDETESPPQQGTSRS